MGSTAYAINNNDQIVGGPYDSGSAFLWSSGLLTELFPEDASSSCGYAINDRGQIAGRRLGLGFFWDQGTATYLTNADTVLIDAYGVNAQGHVVGSSAQQSTNGGAFLYRDGTLFDLNQLIPPDSGWNLHAAYAINDNEQIVGIGLGPVPGVANYRGFLLTPIPSLRIQTSGDAFAIYWSKPAVGYHLAVTTALEGSATVWSPVGATPTDAGDEWMVNTPNNGGNQFFQLQNPSVGTD